MRLSSNLTFLTLVSQGLVALAAPIVRPSALRISAQGLTCADTSSLQEFAETSEILDLRGSENPKGFDAREVSSDLKARERDEAEEMSSRDLADFELALRSLSDGDLLSLEARALITKIVGQVYRLFSSERPERLRLTSRVIR